MMYFKRSKNPSRSGKVAHSRIVCYNTTMEMPPRSADAQPAYRISCPPGIAGVLARAGVSVPGTETDEPDAPAIVEGACAFETVPDLAEKIADAHPVDCQGARQCALSALYAAVRTEQIRAALAAGAKGAAASLLDDGGPVGFGRDLPRHSSNY